jgi:hypothetical protein
LVWVFFSMAAISTPTSFQSALFNPPRTLAAIGGKEMSSRTGGRARDMRAREVALRND